jgi:hypothetical protein
MRGITTLIQVINPVKMWNRSNVLWTALSIKIEFITKLTSGFNCGSAGYHSVKKLLSSVCDNGKQFIQLFG